MRAKRVVQLFEVSCSNINTRIPQNMDNKELVTNLTCNFHVFVFVLLCRLVVLFDLCTTGLVLLRSVIT